MKFLLDFRNFTFILVVVLLIKLYWCKVHAENDIYSRHYNNVKNTGNVYQPIPVQPPPAPYDRNLIFVPKIGLIRGLIAYKTIKHRTVNAFLGLKYGVVGSGFQRFQKSSKPQYLSNGVIDATSEPENCPQFPEIEKVHKLEKQGINPVDCLTMNIYAPNKAGIFPVMVFVHGEMLFDGSAMEAQPNYILEHDVVLISLNYRLAPFGFLTALTDEMPGNIALDDIHMALEWIQQNILHFGGDPRKVTLFGQAGGATLVHALTLSGKVEDLVHKVILQSGTALNPYFIDQNPLITVRSFARYAQCYDRNIKALSSCLSRLNTTDLLKIFEHHWGNNELRGASYTGGFKLVIGDKLGYLPVHPAAMVANNKFPVIAGVTKDVGAFILSRFYKQLIQIQTRNISDFIKVVLEQTTPEVGNYDFWHKWALVNVFTEEDLKNPTLRQLSRGLLELVNVILYRGPIIDTIRLTHQKYPIYLYCFDYRGQYRRFGHLQTVLPFALDADLSDDSIYLFPYPEEVNRLNPDDMIIAKSLSTMWYNFAIYGDPNLDAEVWPRATSEYGPFIRITNSHEKILELDYHYGEGLPIPFVNSVYDKADTTTTAPFINSTHSFYSQYQKKKYTRSDI